MRDETGKILTDKIRIIYFYLPKIREKYYNKSSLSEIEKLLLVFNEQDSMELDQLMEGNSIMKEYNEESKETSKKPEVIGLYDKELYDEMIEYHRIRHAKEEGIEEASKQIAREMLAKGIDISTIAECIGLSVEEINKLS